MATQPRDITITLESVNLPGLLGLPEGTTGLVIFAHGSGSSRLSPRNNFVAEVLRDGGIGTLLFDLLTPEEDMDYSTRFDIELLTQRLVETTDWVQRQPELCDLDIGYFGASTGSAAALYAAAEMGPSIRAVVSRGGRPDLAEAILSEVQSPTLLIVGGSDYQVLELNRMAYAQLHCEKRLAVVPDATHLFEEPGTLAEAAQLAAEWFQCYLGIAGMGEERKAA